jgi:hypothetical protein
LLVGPCGKDAPEVVAFNVMLQRLRRMMCSTKPLDVERRVVAGIAVDVVAVDICPAATVDLAGLTSGLGGDGGGTVGGAVPAGVGGRPVGVGVCATFCKMFVAES